MITGTIIKVAGPLVVAKDIPNAKLYDTVLVSKEELLGEIIEMRGNEASIQVYEETSGIGIGAPVVSQERPLSIELGPGLLSTMMDGIGRDLEKYAQASGHFLTKGERIETLDKTILWDFIPMVEVGTNVQENDRLGYVLENHLKHYILSPFNGVITEINKGEFTVDQDVVFIDSIGVPMNRYWPVRKARKYKEKHLPSVPLITGQRIVDTFFPVAKGGTACIPGPFGSGKTVVQHQLAKWSDSDVVIYIGCGERGNEMTDVLNEFPQIVDPITNEPLMNKICLIANTSNMPVAAREASIYTGMSVAEYYRDMGYDVSLMADSTSRWAEALREMSGRLEEMPGDEGYPAYLGSRLADVYERAGVVSLLGSDDYTGSITMIGAVSPAGGDLNEPVTQSTLRVAKVFWALDASLAYARHFPAINWHESYSLYQTRVDEYMKSNHNKNFTVYRQDAIDLLQEEQRIMEVVQLIGKDSLSDEEMLKLEVARMLREDFLQQNAFQEEDTFTSLDKQVKMLVLIMDFYKEATEALVEDHIFLNDILHMDTVYEISRMKYVSDDQRFDEVFIRIRNEFDTLKQGGDVNERV